MLKNLVLYGFTLAFLQLLIACGPAVDETQAVLEDVETVSTEPDGDQMVEAKEAEILIVAFGDSLYAGYGLDQKEGFAPELQAALTEAGKDVRVHNAGVSGDTTAAGTRANMDAMVKKLKDRGIPVMLTGMLAPPNLGTEFSNEFNVIYPALAKKYDAALYPFFMDGVVGNPDLFLPDGLHPTAKGIDIIVGKIAPQVVDVLEG